MKISNIQRGGVALIIYISSILPLLGQNVDQYFGVGALPFKNRIAIRTNVLDWVLTTPNVAFDYDIVNTPYDKKSIGINLKYNWNTSHTYIPKRVYNLLDVRFDYRYYWRQQPYDTREEDWEREWINSARGFDKMRARVSCFRGAENPKPDVSFFVGPYLSASNFSIKLGTADDALGRQGVTLGTGLTAGIALPLYGYENGSALDLEFGGSAGWHFAAYDIYTADEGSNCYQMLGHQDRWIPYPLVTDVRVSLIFRFCTIAKQHKEVNYDLLDRRYIALLLERDRDSVQVYNAQIKQKNNEIDKLNDEIILYKETIESQPGFNPAYSLEYLNSYVYMMELPKRYTRRNEDTLPKIEIDSIGQITDRILLNARRSIDSIPGMTSADIDKEFVGQYNSLVNTDGKKVLNRTELLKNIYYRLNDNYIRPSNALLVSGSFVTTAYTEALQKFDVKEQKGVKTSITYRDSVRTVEMSYNEKVEWRNSIKKRAWANVQKRAKGIYIQCVEFVDTIEPLYVGDTDSLKIHCIAVDSISLDSTNLDSLITDSTTVGLDKDKIITANMEIIDDCDGSNGELGVSLKGIKEEEEDEEQ